MAPKQAKILAAAAPADEPAAKKAKEDEPKKEEPKVEEEKYQEPDAPKDNRPAMTAQVGFNTVDTTLNVVPTLGGKLLTSLSDGGMSCLIAGARANVGLKTGRYMFEAKIIQSTPGQNNAAKPLMRIGFSTADSGLIVGEDVSSVYFDSEGSFVSAKKRANLKGGSRFGKDQTVAVVLNLDAKSPNANTIALYKDGVAIGSPQPLSEDLKGKTLFPHIAFRAVSVRVNFGATALKELPFKCRLVQGAANSDVVVSASKDPKDGKYEVCMPVGFPDEGTFDWLDAFLEKNPQYVELSDRKIIQWAKASGLQVQGAAKGSNDKPQLNCGVKELDDMSVRKVLSAVAPVIPRNYLVMEVKSNLVATERQETLKKFNFPCYKKVARVVMGEPSKEYKANVQNKLLKVKQTKADNTHKAKVAEVARKKAAAAKQKELAKQRKEAEKKRKAALEEKKKKAEEEKKAKEGDKYVEPEKKDEPAEEPEKEEEQKEEVEEDLGEAPVAELTEEEKKHFFMPKQVSDLTQQVMNSFYGKFSTPEKDEGFDDIVYEWDKGAKAEEYLKTWIKNKKLTTRIEDIKPGKVFREKVTEFTKLTKEWQDKLTAFKAAGAKKPAKKSEEEGDDIDIFSVADVLDVGKGVPLFDQFTFEDWMLMKLRFDFCLLILSFKTDANDPDRAGMPLDHFAFYHQKYFSKPINFKNYGVDDTKDLITLIKDTVSIKEGLVVSTLSDDLDNLDIFLKLTEEHRRERQRRIDAGDETARLKFVAPAENKPAPKAAVAVAPGGGAKPVGPAKPATPAPAASTAAPAKGVAKGAKKK